MTAEELAGLLAKRRHPPRVRRALELVRQGESYRHAANRERVNYKALHRAALGIDGLRAAHLKAWRAKWGDDFPSVWTHHVRRVAATPLHRDSAKPHGRSTA